MSKVKAIIAGRSADDHHGARIRGSAGRRCLAPMATPEALEEWYGPGTAFTITVIAMDFRIGGLFRFTMHGPDGTEYPNRIMYREIRAARSAPGLSSGDDSDERG